MTMTWYFPLGSVADRTAAICEALRSAWTTFLYNEGRYARLYPAPPLKAFAIKEPFG